jgi:hypothetical protein
MGCAGIDQLDTARNFRQPQAADIILTERTFAVEDNCDHYSIPGCFLGANHSEIL